MRLIFITFFPIFVSNSIQCQTEEFEIKDIREDGIKDKISKKNQVENYLSINLRKEEFPQNTAAYLSIERIELRGSHLTKMNNFPTQLFELINTKSLFIKAHELEGIPIGMGKMKKIEKLVLQARELKHLPNDIGDLENLIEFTIGPVSLDSLPSEIGNLAALKKFEFKMGDVCYIPTEFGNLTKLNHLTLKGKMAQLPISIGNLTNLKYFELRSCCMDNLPYTIGKLINLETLDIQSPVKHCPKEIGKLINLKKLVIASKFSFEIPSTINQLENLESLSIPSGNNFFEILPTMQNLQNLRSLTVKAFSTDTLANKLAKLPSLNKLLLKVDNAAEMPYVEGMFSNIDTLTILSNQSESQKLKITDVSFLEKFPNLKYLKILAPLSGQTDFSYLKNHKDLRLIDLSHCQLETLPQGFFSLHQVKQIILNNNQITEISTQILDLESLKSINLGVYQKEARKKLRDEKTKVVIF